MLIKVMLRRTKVEREADIKLPPLSVSINVLEMDACERDFYECIYKQTRSKFDTYVKGHAPAQLCAHF